LPAPSEPLADTDSNRLKTPTKPPPQVDTSVRSVSLDEVVFDTFRGGFIRLSDATPDQIEQLRDAIKPIYEPAYDDVSGGDWLSDGDMVMGYAMGDEAFAYPVKMLNLHEIVNDFIGGRPVVITYCPLCGSAVVYDRVVDGETLVFVNTSALHESDMVMYDHATGSYWFQVLGEAIVGTLTGKRMNMLPSQMLPWGDWKQLYPSTKILAVDQGLLPTRGNPYANSSLAGYPERIDRGLFVFPVSDSKLDDQIPYGTWVITTEINNDHFAYSLRGRSDRAINHNYSGRDLVVFVRSSGPSGSAFFRETDGQTLTFTLTDGIWRDDETGTTWNDSGLAVGGPLTDTRLEPVPSRTSLWFSVSGAIPGLELYDG